MQKKVNRFILGLYAKTQSSMNRVFEKLQEKDGSFFTEHGLAIVIVVVIAAILIVALVALFKDKIFPSLNNKVDGFFALS